MSIPNFTVDQVQNVRRLPADIQLVYDDTMPVFFNVVGGGSSFFFINLAKFVNSDGDKIRSGVVEQIAGGGGLSVTHISFGVGEDIFDIP